MSTRVFVSLESQLGTRKARKSPRESHERPRRSGYRPGDARGHLEQFLVKTMVFDCICESDHFFDFDEMRASVTVRCIN